MRLRILYGVAVLLVFFICSCAPSALTKETKTETGKPDLQSVEYHEFLFKLSECRSLKNKITCDVMITNKGEDRTLMATAEDKGLFVEKTMHTSRIFDELGNEYFAKTIRFGATESAKPQTSLPKDVPIKATLRFSGVSPVPGRLNMLEVGFYNKSYGVFRVWFRNIPLVKTIEESSADKTKSVK